MRFAVKSGDQSIFENNRQPDLRGVFLKGEWSAGQRLSFAWGGVDRLPSLPLVYLNALDHCTVLSAVDLDVPRLPPSPTTSR